MQGMPESPIPGEAWSQTQGKVCNEARPVPQENQPEDHRTQDMRLAQIFEDWSGALSWLRVAGSIVVLTCVFGIVYSIITHFVEGLTACTALVGATLATKAYQTKVEAASQNHNAETS
jgi:hypothetical protein